MTENSEGWRKNFLWYIKMCMTFKYSWCVKPDGIFLSPADISPTPDSRLKMYSVFLNRRKEINCQSLVSIAQNSRNPIFVVISDKINYNPGLKYVVNDVGIFEPNECCIFGIKREWSISRFRCIDCRIADYKLKCPARYEKKQTKCWKFSFL